MTCSEEAMLSETVTRAPNIPTEKSFALRVLSNSVWIVAGEAVGRGLFFLAHVHLARALGVSGFGALTLAQTVTFYLWFAVDLGTSMYGVKEIACRKSESASLVNALMTLRVLAGLCVFVAYMAALFVLPLRHTDRMLFLACGLYLVTNVLYSDWVFKGFERFEYAALGSAVTSIVFLAVSLWLVRGAGDATAGSLAWSMSYLAGAAVLLVFMGRKLHVRFKPLLDPDVWLRHLRHSIYFATSGVLLSAYQYVPILLLSSFFARDELGWFAAGYRIVISINGAGFLLAMAFYPVLSELYQKDRLEFQKAHARFQKTMFLVGVPLGVFGYFYSRQIVHILFGVAYSNSEATFRILVWLVPMYFLRYSYGTTLFIAGLQKKHNLAALTAFVIALLVGVTLLKVVGPSGPAWALLLAESSMVLVMHLSLRDVLRPRSA